MGNVSINCFFRPFWVTSSDSGRQYYSMIGFQKKELSIETPMVETNECSPWGRITKALENWFWMWQKVTNNCNFWHFWNIRQPKPMTNGRFDLLTALESYNYIVEVNDSDRTISTSGFGGENLQISSNLCYRIYIMSPSASQGSNARKLLRICAV